MLKYELAGDVNEIYGKGTREVAFILMTQETYDILISEGVEFHKYLDGKVLFDKFPVVYAYALENPYSIVSVRKNI